MGSTFLKILIAEYCVIAIAFACQGNWAKMTYFVGAIILSIGVLWMK